MILIALLTVLCIGILSIRALTRNQLPSFLQITLGINAGFCIVGLLTFFQLLILNLFSPIITFGISLSLIGYLLFLNRHYPLSFNKFSTETLWIIGTLSLLAILLTLQATNYPLGGWDAWSCWNLKAKFIYLGQTHFKDMFLPELWRSNTHYPLLLPSIIAYGWQWIGHADQIWPMICAIVFSLNSAALLIATLRYFKAPLSITLGLATIIFATPFCTILSISQYSDILVGLLTLSALCCFFLMRQFPSLVYGLGLFIGALSFTKTEGLVLAGLLTIIFLITHAQLRSNWRFYLSLIIAGLATIVFQLTLAPSNEAFINGLTSTEKPSNLARLQLILIYPFMEIIGLKWQGLWIILLAGILLHIKQAFNAQLRVFAFILLGYMTIVCAYYYVNTFFEITWWLNTTLHRLIFALLPTVALWLGLAIAYKNK